MKDILDLTYIQFKNIIEGIGHKINFDIRLSVITVSDKPIETSDLPLYVGQEAKEKFTMSDAMKLQELVQG